MDKIRKASNITLPYREDLEFVKQVARQGGAKICAGATGQLAAAVLDMAKFAQAHGWKFGAPAPLTDAEYLEAMRESDARLFNHPDGNV